MVTISPPAAMPRPTRGAKLTKPMALARTSKSQLQLETNLSMRCWVFTLKLSPNSEVSQFLDCQTNISYGCNDPEHEKNNGHPRTGIKFPIEVLAYAVSYKYRQRDLQAQAAIIGQLLDITPISLFQNISELIE